MKVRTCLFQLIRFAWLVLLLPLTTANHAEESGSSEISIASGLKDKAQAYKDGVAYLKLGETLNYGMGYTYKGSEDDTLVLTQRVETIEGEPTGLNFVSYHKSPWTIPKQAEPFVVSNNITLEGLSIGQYQIISEVTAGHRGLLKRTQIEWM